MLQACIKALLATVRNGPDADCKDVSRLKWPSMVVLMFSADSKKIQRQAASHTETGQQVTVRAQAFVSARPPLAHIRHCRTWLHICSYLKCGAVNGAKHVMLSCQRHVSGHMHQLSRLQQSTRCLGCFGRQFLISAACCPRLLLLGVLVCTVWHKADHTGWRVTVIIVICL